MTSLRQRVIEQAALMAGGGTVDPERYAHLSDVDDQASRSTAKPAQQQLQTLRPAGEASSNRALDALPEHVREPLRAAIGEALAEQELVHEANGVINTPADAVRFLRPADFVGQDGKPDLEAIRTALQDLAVSRRHLAAPQRRRVAAADSGQGAGHGIDGQQSRVSAVLAQMNDPDQRYQLGTRADEEHYRR